MIFSALYLCIAKQTFITSFLVLKAHIVLNISIDQSIINKTSVAKLSGDSGEGINRTLL